MNSVRHSQTTVNSPTRLFNISLSLDELVAIYKHSNYLGDPIAVVKMPDGKLTSLDNRRLWAARRAGLEAIPATVHDPDEPWGTSGQQRSMSRPFPVIDMKGELGRPGRVVLEANARPTTHLLAVVRRCANQTALHGGPVPLLGVEGDARVDKIRPVTRSLVDDLRILRWAGQNGPSQEPPGGPADRPPGRGPQDPRPPGRGPIER